MIYKSYELPPFDSKTRSVVENFFKSCCSGCNIIVWREPRREELSACGYSAVTRRR
ncbi:hypothetical protein Plhal304r1_c092g0172461 [Plasmopara halstedii]